MQRQEKDEVGAVWWVDVATLKVPPRTQRKTALRKWLDQEEVTDERALSLEDATAFRLLDADSATEISAGLRAELWVG